MHGMCEPGMFFDAYLHCSGMEVADGVSHTLSSSTSGAKTFSKMLSLSDKEVVSNDQLCSSIFCSSMLAFLGYIPFIK